MIAEETRNLANDRWKKQISPIKAAGKNENYIEAPWENANLEKQSQKRQVFRQMVQKKIGISSEKILFHERAEKTQILPKDREIKWDFSQKAEEKWKFRLRIAIKTRILKKDCRKNSNFDKRLRKNYKF